MVVVATVGRLRREGIDVGRFLDEGNGFVEGLTCCSCVLL